MPKRKIKSNSPLSGGERSDGMKELNIKRFIEDPRERDILNIIRKRPCSSETISMITGLSPQTVCNELERLSKWGEIQRITKKELIIWGLKRGGGKNE